MDFPQSGDDPLGVCSWSLQADSESALADCLGLLSLTNVQLALDPIRRGAWSRARLEAALDGVGGTVRSGMMGTVGEDYSSLQSIRRTGGLTSHEHWAANLAAARANAAIASDLGLDLVSLHAGFLPESTDDPQRAILLDRLRQVADTFWQQDIAVALETGQETAATLLAVLAELDHPGVGVNFDPANMLLYDMGEPVTALRQLLPHVKQIHIKDAMRPQVVGTWGEEVPVGQGEVDWASFFAVLGTADFRAGLMIEREAGSERMADIRGAADLVRRHWPAAERASQ